MTITCKIDTVIKQVHRSRTRWRLISLPFSFIKYRVTNAAKKGTVLNTNVNLHRRVRMAELFIIKIVKLQSKPKIFYKNKLRYSFVARSKYKIKWTESRHSVIQVHAAGMPARSALLSSDNWISALRYKQELPPVHSALNIATTPDRVIINMTINSPLVPLIEHWIFQLRKLRTQGGRCFRWSFTTGRSTHKVPYRRSSKTE